jgi:hypothetical protein
LLTNYKKADPISIKHQQPTNWWMKTQDTSKRTCKVLIPMKSWTSILLGRKSMLNWGTHSATSAESSSGEILNKVITHYWPHEVTRETRNKKWVSIGDQMEWDGKGNYMAKIQLYTKHCQRNTK